MSEERNWAISAQDGFTDLRTPSAPGPCGLARSQSGRSGLPVKFSLFSAGLALWMMACTTEDSTTEPSARASSAHGAIGTYTALDLGTLGGNFSSAQDVNSAGQVVGISRSADERNHAFLWEKGVMSDLGTLPGSISNDVATGINPKGQVVGNIAGVDVDDQRAFLWEKGAMITLGALDGGTFSEARDINPAGKVVGMSYASGGPFQAFLWEKGAMTKLGTLPGDISSWATAINPAGEVVGYSAREDGRVRAFLWKNGVMTDLGTLGGNSAAHGISPGGQVVGVSETADGSAHAFLWEKGTMTDLGDFTPMGINAAGQIAGLKFVPEAQTNHAVVWTKGVLTDLGTLGGSYSFAAAIDPQGRVVGLSYTTAGEPHATLWMPK